MALFRINAFIVPLILIGWRLPCQTAELRLDAAGSCLFAGKVYCFGLQETGNETAFVVYQLSSNLDTLSSQRFPLSKKPGKESARCWSDTLHNFLNLYLPEGVKQRVSIFRFNRNFEFLKKVEGADITRLYPVAGFENQLFYTENTVYAIQTQKDSSGLQFYLNKYELKPEFESFEYAFKWQFPFERKNIRSAQLFFANPEFVLVFVHVNAGPKQGQWLLKINARNGRLIRGSKLNEKTDENTYQYGNHYYHPVNKSLLLVGQQFSPKQYTAASGRLSIAGESVVSLYLFEYDSIGDPLIRQELKIPVAEAKSQGKKPGTSCIVQIKTVSTPGDNSYNLECDLYKSSVSGSCFTYVNSSNLRLKKEENRYVQEKISLSANPNIESYLSNNDKLDMNGKLCTDSSSLVEHLFLKTPSFPVKILFSNDSLMQPLWILSKSNARKASINFSLLKLQKKIYQISLLEEISTQKNPVAFLIGNQKLVLARQEETGKYLLKCWEP